MTRYYAISLLLHSVVPLLVLLTHPGNKADAKVEGVQAIGAADRRKTGLHEVDIIEISPGAEKTDPRKLTSFYWGIGVTADEHFDVIEGEQLWVVQVRQTHEGYSAAANGIYAGDVIFRVNGLSISPANDVAGPGPKHLRLTIARGTRLLYIDLDRVKVYF